MALVFGSPNDAMGGDAKLGAKMWKDLERMLREGEIRPNRVEVLPGGLGGVEEGIQRMAERKVSGVKVVVRVDETA